MYISYMKWDINRVTK